jgi:hypothetical protein
MECHHHLLIHSVTKSTNTQSTEIHTTVPDIILDTELDLTPAQIITHTG